MTPGKKVSGVRINNRPIFQGDVSGRCRRCNSLAEFHTNGYCDPDLVDRPTDWSTAPNARRKRPMGTITMNPQSWAQLDEMRQKLSRGAFIELMLDTWTWEPARRGRRAGR